MRVAHKRRAVKAAKSVGASLGLAADEAVVLHRSNKLTLRLLPGDVVARVAPAAHGVAQFELDLAVSLAQAGCPVATPDRRVKPRVHSHDGFDITLWTHYEPVAPQEIPPDEYAQALARLHAGMREVAMPTPHFTDRVASAQQLVADRDRTPELVDADRELLADTLRDMRSAVTGRGAEQLLHGEPHPGNLLATKDGPVFIDFETCCRGPIEFDLAHAPDPVGDHYPGADAELLRQCRILVLAMITTWRWDRDDQLPDGHRLAQEWLTQIRAAL
ncbi:phosphotransferase enzyme family protein [Stackebrandtia nassauensis]|uniref:Aminoglycoside phosphotransferase n=1 Tax=Stackebrandtia nassauensis (strain DSM 44728 / CIP 108903 / NRRL B-16338 / NBRC 102104 / LLR-40K-21) TaxID=446470 RepID=D3PWA1_STANL|nr:aminoglycoside phosphotransferase family protein [Stackebrandtia nassauensis]ADD41258.1 aminoglycoside phosphotransferase [Stackebrandtia nassauensis DSM 44728]